MKSSTNLGAFQQFSLCSFDVFRLACPGEQDRVLEGPSIAEGQRPRSQQGNLVNGIEVDRGILFRLAAGQESDA